MTKITASINLLAWLSYKGVNITYFKGDNGLTFGAYESNEEVEKIKCVYRNNTELQDYLAKFKEVKMIMMGVV